MTPDKWNRLSFLKLLSCIFIMIFHLDNSFKGIFTQHIPFIQKYGGYLGNYTFFILSGFCMDYSYKHKLIHGNYTFKQFITSKLIKIYPIYFLSLLFYVCILGPSSINMKKEILSFLMISSGWVDDIYPDNTVAWFFCVIMLLYIIYYFVCFLQNKISFNLYLPVFIILIFAGYSLYSLDLSFPFMYAHDGEGLLYFSIGVCLSNFMKTHTTKTLKFLSYLGILILLMYSILCIKYDVDTVSGDTALICGIMISTITIIWLLNTHFMSCFFKKIAPLGSISMEMCLFHLPVNHIFYHLNTSLKNNTLIWILLYITTLIILSASCHFIILKIRGLYQQVLCTFSEEKQEEISKSGTIHKTF